MSVKVMTLVWDLDLPMTDKFVLVAIADAANDDGVAWPSMTRLADKCSMSRQTIKNVVKRLETSGLLRIENRMRDNGSHASNVYEIVVQNTGGVGNVVAQGGQRGCPGVGNVVAHHKNRKIEPSIDSSPVASAPASQPQKKSQSDHAWLTRWWCFAFAVITAEQYAFGKKAAGQIRDLLKALPLEEVVSRACCYLALAPEQRFPRGSPTLEGLQAMVNQLAGRCSDEIEDKCWKLGLLPDTAETPLRAFRPWENTGDHPQLPLH